MLSKSVLLTRRPAIFFINNAARASFQIHTKSETYTEKMEKTGRPISPHVTIYAFPAAAISSIMNRFTGLALVTGNIRIYI